MSLIFEKVKQCIFVENIENTGGNITCLQMAVIHSCPHTIALLVKYGATMTPFISGESILNQLVETRNILALDFLFHRKSSNLWLNSDVIYFHL